MYKLKACNACKTFYFLATPPISGALLETGWLVTVSEFPSLESLLYGLLTHVSFAPKMFACHRHVPRALDISRFAFGPLLVDQRKEPWKLLE